jgi:hypothetical protein
MIPQQDARELVRLWRGTRQTYARGPVILACVMDLGSKLADTLEALSESSVSSETPRGPRIPMCRLATSTYADREGLERCDLCGHPAEQPSLASSETQEERSASSRLTVIVAQLRHAYGQLIYEPHRDRAWDDHARKSFADGLIAPQIRALEKLIAAAQPSLSQPAETIALVNCDDCLRDVPATDQNSRCLECAMEHARQQRPAETPEERKDAK